MGRLRALVEQFWTDELDLLAADAAALAENRPSQETLHHHARYFASRQRTAQMSFDKTIHLPVDADEAFALITQPERLRRWKTVAARVDLRVGGEYRWTIIPGHHAAGTFQEIEPGKRIVFTWGWESATDLPPGASTVTITLEPDDGGTSLRLVHEGLTPEQSSGARRRLEPLPGTPGHGNLVGLQVPARTNGPPPLTRSTTSSPPTRRWQSSWASCASSPRKTVKSRRRARTSLPTNSSSTWPGR